MNTIRKLYVIGQEITFDELAQAYHRIKGHAMAPGQRPSTVARLLANENSARFVHEINRARGYAIDMGEEIR